MTTYIHLRAGDYGLLVETSLVREVFVLVGADDQGTVGHRVWRGETLPVIDLPLALGGKMGERAAAVVFDNGAGGRTFLDVDAINRVIRLDDCEFRPLPPLPGALEAAFDGIASAAGQVTGLLRLKSSAPFLAAVGSNEACP